MGPGNTTVPFYLPKKNGALFCQESLLSAYTLNESVLCMSLFYALINFEKLARPIQFAFSCNRRFFVDFKGEDSEAPSDIAKRVAPSPEYFVLALSTSQLLNFSIS
jgi:hypothetical protein